MCHGPTELHIPLPSQGGKTVNVILVADKDMRVVVPPHTAENVCDRHRNAVINAVFRLNCSVRVHGVKVSLGVASSGRKVGIGNAVLHHVRIRD